MTNNPVPDSVVNKIKALLRLASSDNDAERSLALVKAKELATKHDLELSSISAWDNKPSDEPIIKGEFKSVGGRVSICQNLVTSILQNHFNVKVLYWGRQGNRTIGFVGRGRDIEFAEFANNFLNEEFLRLWRKYYAANQFRVQLKDRGGYIYGLFQGLNEKLTLAQKKTEVESFEAIAPETREQTKQTYALMVTTHKQRLQDTLEDFYPNLRSTSMRSNIKTHNCIGDGKTAGRNINIARPIGNAQSNRICA